MFGGPSHKSPNTIYFQFREGLTKRYFLFRILLIDVLIHFFSKTFFFDKLYFFYEKSGRSTKIVLRLVFIFYMIFVTFTWINEGGWDDFSCLIFFNLSKIILLAVIPLHFKFFSTYVSLKTISVHFMNFYFIHTRIKKI